MKLYKVLKADMSCCNGGQGKWYPKKWMPKIEGELIPCKNGYHLCRVEDLVQWLNETIWEVEYKGDILEHDDKVVVRQARLIRKLDAWNEKNARLFAVDCAKRALKIWDKYYPEDKRPHEAVKQAYLFTLGKTTRKKMAAAWDAAWDAVRAAAWDAAGAAAGAAAGYAAGAAAGYAAGAAAWDAARAAAGAAAWDAVRAAAGAAAWDAAGAAARAAERKWQTKRLKKYLELDRPGG